MHSTTDTARAPPAASRVEKTTPGPLVEKFSYPGGKIKHPPAVTTAVSGTTPHHVLLASRQARSPAEPLVFHLTQRAPCITSASNASTPTRMVYQSRIPVSSPRRKSVQSGSKK